MKKALLVIKSDTEKVNTLNKLCNYYRNVNLDSASFYTQQAIDISKACSFFKGGINALNNLGYVYFYQGKQSLAFETYRTAYDLSGFFDYKLGLGNAIYNMGLIYSDRAEYPKTIEYYNEALKIFEELHDTSNIASITLNIGLVNHELKRFDLALEYQMRALNLYLKKGSKSQIGNAYARIGNIWVDAENPKCDLQIAEEYYMKSLDLFNKDGNLRGVAIIYNNMADVYTRTNRKNLVLDSYYKALKMRESIGDKNGVVIILSNLGTIYAEKKDFINAENYYLKSQMIAHEIGFAELTRVNYKLLARLYAKKGLYKKAYDYFEQFSNLNDSIFNIESAKQVGELREKYEADKKENKILLLNKESELKTVQITKQHEISQMQRFALIIVICGIIILAILLVFTIRLYFNKKFANRMLAEQKLQILEKNEELQQQKEEIISQKEEIEIQNTFLVQANKTIEYKNKNITDSIKYAQRIQSAILSPEDLIFKTFKEAFVLYKPKSIVSGDFYMVETHDGNIYVAVVDCTGHGVPGALLSIVGHNILTQAIKIQNFTNTGDILNFLNINLIKTLHLTDEDSSLKDGMDMVLCKINLKEHLLEFSGAHNPLYLIRNRKLLEFKTDNFPIGKYFNARFEGYSSQRFQLETNDIIYLFTDGYADQFNQENAKKYSSQQLKQKLIEINDATLIQQKLFLLNSFAEWKGSAEQIDDICILGIKI